jgi:formate/nitrite transporter FocA (FNT family)
VDCDLALIVWITHVLEQAHGTVYDDGFQFVSLMDVCFFTTNLLFAFCSPTGLIMTLVSGSELFTGNTALVTSAYMEEKATAKDLLKNWCASYIGNFIGSLIVAYLAFASGTLGKAPGAVALATAKCSTTFGVAFVRGILCNWLVCMAVYMYVGVCRLLSDILPVGDDDTHQFSLSMVFQK